MNREAVAQLLQRFGVTPTSQRLDVGQVILCRPQHLSAEQIISQVQGAGSRVSKATVYNTLNLFCNKGLLRTVNVDPTRQFYDSTTTSHHHFYNEDTGELTDIAPDAVEFQRMPELPPGTHASGIEVVVRIRRSESQTES